MTKFTDAQGDDWHLAVNVSSIKVCREEAACDLLDIGGGLFDKILADPVTLVDVLWVLCRDKAKERDIDEVAFAHRLAGDTLDGATTALIDSLIAFFPQRRRAVLEAAWKKFQALETRVTEHAAKIVNDPRIDKIMEAELKKVDEQLAAASGGS